MNNHQAFTEAIDQLIETLKADKNEKIDRKQVGFWLPKEYKLKYEVIQRLTDRKFGKAIQGLIIQAIEKVQIEEV